MISHWLTAYLDRHIPNVEFQQNTTNRILSSGAGNKTMLLHMAEDHIAQAVFVSHTNMKSERQARYITKADSHAPRKSYQIARQIGLVLHLRNSDRNNQVLNLLSAPGYGITISTKQTLLWKTRIANVEMKKLFRAEVYLYFLT